MRAKLEQKQLQKLSPAALQLIEMLQMGSMEFEKYIEKEIEENPVFDFEESRFYDRGFGYAGKGREERFNDPVMAMSARPFAASLYEDVCMQLDSLGAQAALTACAKLMARHLDRRGYLPAEDFHYFSRSMGEDRAGRALKLIQSLSPAGLGARDLSECLCLQLERMPCSDGLCSLIVREHLELVAKGHYKRIAQLCSASAADVQRACRIIRSLDPRPAGQFETQDCAPYLMPDFIYDEDKSLCLGRSYSPALSLNPGCQELMAEADSPEVKAYLEEKFQRARQLIANINKRNNSAFKCMQAIIEKQQDFFESGGKSPLLPLTQGEIAHITGYSESTISRLVSGKYIQCYFGTYPLSHFFNSALKAEEKSVSSTDVKGRICALVGAEDKAAPLSDQDIAETLERTGISISRRTVAKYRQELGIPGTYARKV